MVFSSTVFIFCFLPVTLVFYFLMPSIKTKNLWLLAASLFFYFWGGSAFFSIILYSIVLNYIGGLGIGYFQKWGKMKARKIFFVFYVSEHELCDRCISRRGTGSEEYFPDGFVYCPVSAADSRSVCSSAVCVKGGTTAEGRKRPVTA